QKGKQQLLNEIINDLMASCDSIKAVIIADWQGLSFASKLPENINEQIISATTLFTIEGAEGTRKELEYELLGNKLSYLIMATEDETAFMIIFPIGNIGYIASVSKIREDLGLITQNMKIAAKKVKDILIIPPKDDRIMLEVSTEKPKYMETFVATKYESILEKLKNLKKIASTAPK
ncbi:MAG: roadblock/LC7 domain-containing protein, partial [Candidatus Hodarchaeota archaeon]